MSEEGVQKIKKDKPGLSFHNCNVDQGGTPLCKLPMVPGYRGGRYVNTIHVKGASGGEVYRKDRDSSYTTKREYDVFIIGEAPGKEEDQLGVPFVGKAGGILSEFLLKSGFDLSRTYVTNTVKCRPPDNRNPSVKEIKACARHLEYELRKHQPKLILLLGAVALRTFNLHNKGGMQQIHGQVFELKHPEWEDGPTFTVIPTYHPAFFVHQENPRLMRRVLDDYIYAKNILKTGNVKADRFYKADYDVLDTVDKVKKVVEKIKANKIFAFDTETPNLKFWSSPMITLQLSIGKDQNWILPIYRHDPEGLDWKLKPQWTNEERKEVIELIRPLFESEDFTKIAFHAKYDIKVLRRWLEIETKGWMWDVQNMHHLLFEYRPHDLEFLLDMEFSFGPYSDPVKEIVGKGKDLLKTYDHIPDEILHQYGATDVEGTYCLCHIFYEQLEKKPHLLKLYKEEDLPTLYSLADAEYTGNKIDTSNLKKLQKLYEDKITKILGECRKFTKPDFNPASHDQVAQAFVDLGLSDAVYSPKKSKGFDTSKEKLLAINHPLAQLVVEYRHINKFKSTYVDNLIEDLDDDGRLRYSFRHPGTTSGRLSAPVLHQIPRLDEDADQADIAIRSIFSEEEDFLYVYGDYSQVELRIFAYLTGEQELIDVLERGDDIHRLTTAAALGIPFDSPIAELNRSNVGKRLNFGVIYGSEGYSVAKGTYFDEDGNEKVIGQDTAFEFVANFRRRYKKVDFFLKDIPLQCRANGNIIANVFGRERRMMGSLDSREEGKRKKAEREVTNFMIQGPAGSITLRTMNVVNKMLKDYNIGLDRIRFLNSVHDSMAYGVHKSLVDWFVPAFKTLAERSIPELGNKTFEFKIGVGNNWAEAEVNSK